MLFIHDYRHGSCHAEAVKIIGLIRISHRFESHTKISGIEGSEASASDDSFPSDLIGVPLEEPLHDVSAHVVETEVVGLFHPDGVRGRNIPMVIAELIPGDLV